MQADRLFELGFAAQLTEILHALPQSSQKLLFSATLPKSLVEFARAGLQEPSLIRLDSESKISPDLQSCFFTLKGAEREGALLHLLHDVLKIPSGLEERPVLPLDRSTNKGQKRKRGDESVQRRTSDQSTMVFASTKHHVSTQSAFN